MVKIAFLGAGSHVFGPSFLADALLDSPLRGYHLALVEPDPALLTRTVALAEAFSTRCQATVSGHADYRDALDGADFVVSAVAVQMHSRFARDVEIIRRHNPDHLITEFGGIHGISYSLRQIAFHAKLGRGMADRAPRSWLLTVANPLPRVVQAVEDEGVRCAGFCSVSLVGYRKIWEILEGKSPDYPFEEPREKLAATMAGTNRLSWLLGLRDAESGEDLMPKLRSRSKGNGLSEHYFERTGYLPMSGDDHIRDFLPPTPGEAGLEHISHGGADSRTRQLSLLEEVAADKTGFERLLEHRAWEHPMQWIDAMAGSLPRDFHSVNLRNEGQISNLPRGAIVETSAKVEGASIVTPKVSLPETVEPLNRNAVELTLAICQAAKSRRWEDLRTAMDLDPTILDAARDWAALRECVEANADLVGAFR